eukprot:CAMPEP_0184326162 /NCGR_PEP_ID=MMETSP1049-20130417/142363_1 /TAXON_ID=77928 /ORGANISM="Proteomonas sulcata, Strain CCMP704" /LENGTH=77 /DNA_ID=CAMNT_0026648339 /DNA_START=2077 /DNA_END=2310 /DNA_ORIENTATION=+
MAPKDDSEDFFSQFVTTPAYTFYRDSKMLVRRCAKPDKNEFSKIALATGVGFLVMGFIGFFVKLMFIPINNIIVSNL